jgi:lambda repressor-like predicted transcriptional regulator
MDLYKYHAKSAILQGHHEADDLVPERIMKIVRTGKKLTQKQEDVISKDKNHAYEYAVNYLEKPWPKGEDAIAKDSWLAYRYAHFFRKPFPKGEDAISKNATWAYWYAAEILTRRWPKGEGTIAKSEYYADLYYQRFGIKL